MESLSIGMLSGAIALCFILGIWAGLTRKDDFWSDKTEPPKRRMTRAESPRAVAPGRRPGRRS